MSVWSTTPLAESGGATHWVADLTSTDDDGTHRALCDPLLVMPDARPARDPHGYCVGCLAVTAVSPDWCVTDLQILREAADSWMLPRLITHPDELERSLPAQGVGATGTGYGSSYAWARDGLRVWAGKRPGALLVDRVPATRLLPWTALKEHAAEHSTEEQRWWLAELEAWERHWWTEGLDSARTLQAAQAFSRRSQQALTYQSILAAPTWADDTLAHQPMQLDMLALLEGLTS